MTLNTHEARQLLAELEMISHGSTQAFDTSGGHSSEKPFMPPGESNPPHLVLRSRLVSASTQGQVDKIARDAREALQKARYTPPQTNPEWGSFEWRRQIARDIDSGKRDIPSAMSHYHLSRATVYRYLAAYGRNAA